MLNWIWGCMILLGAVGAFVQFFLYGDSVLSDMTKSLFDSADLALKVVLELAGMMCFWLGISRILDKTGATNFLARLLSPLFRVILPGIPAGHPAEGSITLNMAANMLGLDNAATPLGIRAMKDLETLNPDKGTASNSEIMFLVINTSSVTLIPVSIFLYRSKFGAASPVDVFLPILLATSASTLAGVMATALVQKINIFKLPVFVVMGLIMALAGGTAVWASYAGASLAHEASAVADGIILFFIAAVVLIGMIKKCPVYEDFCTGAKEGFKTCIDILPYLVGMLSAVAIFRAGGVLDLILSSIRIVFEKLSLDTSFVDALPVAFMHPLSGGGARALMLDIFQNFGVDSFAGRLASVMQGSTETTFYVLAVYFGSVGIVRTRHAVPCGIVADVTSAVAAIIVCYIFFAE